MSPEQLGEILADFEIRISTLENSMPYHREDIAVIKESPEPAWSKKQWDTVQQLHAQVLYLQKQVKELAIKKKKGKVTEITDFQDFTESQEITDITESYRKLQK